MSHAEDWFDRHQEEQRRNEQQRQDQWRAMERNLNQGWNRYQEHQGQFNDWQRREQERLNGLQGQRGRNGSAVDDAEFETWLRNEEQRSEQLRRQGRSQDEELFLRRLQRGQQLFSGSEPAYGGFCCDGWDLRLYQLLNAGSQVGEACVCYGQGYGVVCQ